MTVYGGLFDPKTRGTIYLGTDVGVLRSDDYGLHWKPVGTALPDYAVTAL